jgi:hypothetical protein
MFNVRKFSFCLHSENLFKFYQNPDPHSSKMLDPDPHITNADPKHWQWHHLNQINLGAKRNRASCIGYTQRVFIM